MLLHPEGDPSKLILMPGLLGTYKSIRCLIDQIHKNTAEYNLQDSYFLDTHI